MLKDKRGVFTLVIMGAFITFCLGIVQTLASPMVLSFSDSSTLGTLMTVLPLPFFGRTKKKVVPNYMAGVGIDDGSYVGSMGATVDVSLRNWYMNSWFGEDRIRKVGEAVTAIVIVVLLVIAIAGVEL